MKLFKSRTATMKPPGEDRRASLRRAVNARGVVCGTDIEVVCLIVDLSDGGMRVRMDRGSALPSEVVVVDVADAVAYPAEVVWQRGQEAGLRQTGAKSLRGLAPARLIPARDAWLRAGGR
ncbi:MAG: PilZ domain-containing protein [Candidatus Brevundimonas colombiensis]|uniref:PilZ domain-containing protein n=1 Tax=Candidatus Brevundimonas colombiensis TaxID=3121376 RepID=A0AAJ5X5P4_9CAUL|nr:PilZ domain-containing protein [Brevundimonas sp.]WEK40860.1 MAG: PilZ domain-containing protein [Brevundimonas sp.]